MSRMTMTAERFQAIVAAYGAEPRRWPDAERDAALAFLAAESRAQAWLDAERGLDAMLDLLAEPDVAARPHADTLHKRVMAGIAAPARWPSRTARVMWASLGLAACLAGGMLGVDLSLKSLSDVRAQSVLEQTAMIDTE